MLDYPNLSLSCLILKLLPPPVALQLLKFWPKSQPQLLATFLLIKRCTQLYTSFLLIAFSNSSWKTHGVRFLFIYFYFCVYILLCNWLIYIFGFCKEPIFYKLLKYFVLLFQSFKRSLDNYQRHLYTSYYNFSWITINRTRFIWLLIFF